MDEKKHIPLPLKYRPMRFSDVIGQEHVVRTLCNAIEADRVANAYLFVGSRGIGKTTLSRIFAKALNCLSPEGREPCCKCSNCLEIARGGSMDVTEIDAASHNKVDDVKPIIEDVQFKPSSSKYKIFVIDECHMLSSAAWNALLKTLEEPPPYARFVFATTEGEKVLPTIVSRCQRFDLRRIQTHDIVSRLEHICKEEGIDADDDTLLAIARGAEGGMRDALSSLDQLIAFTGGKITENDALGVFGLVSRAALEGLADAIIAGDVKSILERVESFDSAGKNMRRVAAELMAHFRNLIVVQAAGSRVPSLEATDAQIATLERQAAAIDPSRVFRICDQLAELEEKLRYTLSVRAQIELTLIRASRIASTATVEELMRAVRELKSQTQGGGVSVPARPAPVQAAATAVHIDGARRSISLTAPAAHAAATAVHIDGARRSISLTAPAAHAAAPAVPPQTVPEPVVPESSDPGAMRSKLMDDPKLNSLLLSVPGAKIRDIREA